MFEAALSLAPHTAAIFAKLGATFAAMHRFKQAASEYGKAARLEPENVGLRLQKVAMFVRMRAIEQAHAELDDCEDYLQARLR